MFGLTKWWEYAIIAGVIFLIGAGGGYKTGSLFMQAKDAGIVEAAQQAVAAHDADVAKAEREVREQVTKEKDAEIAYYREHERLAAALLSESNKKKEQLMQQLRTNQARLNEAAKNDKQSEDFLNAPLPSYLRNDGGLPSQPASDPVGTPGHGGS